MAKSYVNTGFLARYVWFPVDELKIRITLPTKITSAPFVDASSCGKAIQPNDFFRDGLLHISPPLDSKLHPSKLQWPASPEMRARDSKYLTNVSPRTWELILPKLDPGSCYSLNWELPGKDFEPISRKSGKEVRQRPQKTHRSQSQESKEMMASSSSAASSRN